MEYAEKLPWASFSVLSQPNTGGPATGRNRIIEEAQGDYIFFVDVDDYLGPQAIERMLAQGAVKSADVVIGKFVGVGRGVPAFIFRKSTPRTNVAELSLTDSMNVLKMYRTDFIRELSYRFNPSIRMAEDHPFTLGAYAFAECVAIEGDVDCYFWVRHSSPAGAAQHLTGHVLPVKSFYAYMHESFGVLGLAAAANAPFFDQAKLRYWDRLLGLDIPAQLVKDRGPEGNSQSVAAAREIVDQYGADAFAGTMRGNANVMLGALRMRDESAIRGIARQVRKGPWA